MKIITLTGESQKHNTEYIAYLSKQAKLNDTLIRDTICSKLLLKRGTIISVMLKQSYQTYLAYYELAWQQIFFFSLCPKTTVQLFEDCLVIDERRKHKPLYIPVTRNYITFGTKIKNSNTHPQAKKQYWKYHVKDEK